jgi:vanadium chloroperoxidase
VKALYPDFTQVVEEALNGFDFPPNDPGWAFGDDIAKRILQDRLNDGHDKGGAAPGLQRYWQHREDPTNLGQGFLGERWGEVAWFSAPGLPTQNPHPIPRSNAYNDALDEVRVKGSKLPNSGTPNTSPVQQRTPDETCIALYWAYDGASQIGTPPRLYNQIIRLIAAQRFNGAVRMAAHARLLALANVAMADAGIAAWYYKYHYQLWRPVLGIREHDDSFHMKGPPNTPDASKPNPTLILHRRCDPFWTPLGAPRTNEVGKLSFTPPFPAYPSGHATFGAAAFEIVRLFLGVPPNSADTISFDLISDEMNGRSLDSDGSFRGRHLRRYPSLLDAMFDNALSRVFLGVHWRFDGLGQNVTNASKILTDNSNIGGIPVGRKIAQDIFNGGMTHAGGSKETLTAWSGALTA